MVRYEVPIMSKKKQQDVKIKDQKGKSYLVEIVTKNKYLVEIVAGSGEEARKMAKDVPLNELVGNESAATREVARIWYGNHS